MRTICVLAVVAALWASGSAQAQVNDDSSVIRPVRLAQVTGGDDDPQRALAQVQPDPPGALAQVDGDTTVDRQLAQGGDDDEPVEDRIAGGFALAQVDPEPPTRELSLIALLLASLGWFVRRAVAR